ncbi:MAG: bis(5'-nucleosyl)-tetraphosphatase (symmetrical) YqeK [Clostridiales Family XIII bacterium]|jgi:predicted HD superfamily hydrolase involved in NAD metabolism|nr:bis(5'-nucleosyl)-tetraphosphatase (symmetrical) YqeK [Clostridiales Family XIII bacterium]
MKTDFTDKTAETQTSFDGVGGVDGAAGAEPAESMGLSAEKAQDIAGLCGLADLFREMRRRLDAERFKHVEGVAVTAYVLARRYGADTRKAVAAALYHDYFRGAGGDELDALIDKYGLETRLKGRANISHGKIAAAYMETERGIDDDDLLNAVRFHTTGRSGMSLLEKIVYVADSAEPGRVYPNAGGLRAVAVKDLDEACIFALRNTIRYVEKSGQELDEDTLKALEQFISENK